MMQQCMLPALTYAVTQEAIALDLECNCAMSCVKPVIDAHCLLPR